MAMQRSPVMPSPVDFDFAGVSPIGGSPVVQSPLTPLAEEARGPEPDEALREEFANRYRIQDDLQASGPSSAILDVDECLSIIEKNDVTFVVTDTGTGKSSLIPKALMERGCRVVSSQPRRTATINLALRVADLLKEKLGRTVGYWVRGEHVGDDSLPLMFMTSYALFLHVISRPKNFAYTHFVIDEFHERQADVEVLLALLKLAKLHLGRDIKIILMSASVEVEEWKEYFHGLTVGEYSTCTQRFPVYDFFGEEVCRLVGAAFNPIDPTERDFNIHLTVKQHMYLAEQLLGYLANVTTPSHSALVFLPGRTHVEQLAQRLKAKFGEQLDPIPWYRDIELSTIQSQIRRTAMTRKKVYLATDIAEVSLTLSDVVFVIDLGLTKKPRIDPRDRNSVAFPPLVMQLCSRSSVAQRRGRVGRVQQGFYLTCLQRNLVPSLEQMVPQILNSRINELSLHILEIASNPVAAFNLCVKMPLIQSLELSLNVLQDTGCAMPVSHPKALDEAITDPEAAPWREVLMSHPDNKDVAGTAYVTTFRGFITQHLPLNIEGSSLVYLGVIYGMETLMCLAAAVAGCGSPFFVLQEDPNAGNASRDKIRKLSAEMKRRSHGTKCDLVASLDIVIECQIIEKKHGMTDDGLTQWCKENGSIYSRIQSIRALDAQIKNQLAEHLSFRDVEDPEALIEMLKQNARAISVLSAAAHLERGLFVENDAARQQRLGTAGPSIFFNLRAQRDFSVASTSEWNVGSVVVPLSLQLRYGRLLAAAVTQLTQTEFNMLAVLTTFCVFVEPVKDPATGEDMAFFGVRIHGRQIIFRCDGPTSGTIFDFRRRTANCMRVARVMMKEHLTADNTTGIEQKLSEFVNVHGMQNSVGPSSTTENPLQCQQQLLKALKFIFEKGRSWRCEPAKRVNFAPTICSTLLTANPVEFNAEEVPMPPPQQQPSPPPPPQPQQTSTPPVPVPPSVVEPVAPVSIPTEPASQPVVAQEAQMKPRDAADVERELIERAKNERAAAPPPPPAAVETSSGSTLRLAGGNIDLRRLAHLVPPTGPSPL